MKKSIRSILYATLLLIELLVGSTLMLLLWSNTFHLACVVTVVIWAAVTVWQAAMLTKATDVVKRHKLKRNVTLAMMIPTAAFIGMVIWSVITYMVIT